MNRELAAVSDLLDRRELEAARRALSPLLEKSPEDPELTDVLAELLLSERRPEAALDAARRALALGGESADRWVRLGRCFNNLGQMVQAERAFRKAAAQQPGNADVYASLGHVLRRQRRPEEAEAMLRKALEIDPDHVSALRTLGLLRLISGDAPEAIRRLRRAVSASPGDAGLRGHLGLALHRSGNLEAAENAYRSALEMDDRDVETWTNLGMTLQDLGRIEDAIEAYEAAASRSPDKPAPLHRLAEALLIAGDAGRALSIAEKADALDPGHPTGISVRIAALQALGRKAEASSFLGLDRMISSIDIPCPPGFADMGRFNRALAVHIMKHPTLAYEPQGHATRGGRHTRDLLIGDKGPVAALETAVLRAVDDYLKRLEPVPGHPFHASVPSRHRLNMWAVVMGKEGHQLPHIHPAAWLSGVYYVELPETLGSGEDDVAGWIEFGLPPTELRPSADSAVRLFQPVEGRLFLFPAFLYHRTIPFVGDHRRISIAFDLLRKPGG